MKRSSPRQALADINRLLKQCDDDQTKALEEISHIKRIGASTPGRASMKGMASTNLTACADECPCHAVRQKYYDLRLRIGAVQRKALIANAARDLANLEQLAKARTKITLALYASAKKAARSRKELAGLLGVSAEGLRKWEKKNLR